MSKYRGPVCRLCRREGEKLFLKGERCYTAKCAVERRESAPGDHGKARSAFSQYKVQLREKQKVKRIFNILEKPFRLYFEKAARRKGVTGTVLLQRLERRLDSICYRLGFGASRRQARVMVNHGHILVNGKCVTIPSYPVEVGDVIEVIESSRANQLILASMEAATARMIPEWLSLDKGNFKGTVSQLPTREQMPQGIKEQLIVELYSR